MHRELQQYIRSISPRPSQRPSQNSEEYRRHPMSGGPPVRLHNSTTTAVLLFWLGLGSVDYAPLLGYRVNSWLARRKRTATGVEDNQHVLPRVPWRPLAGRRQRIKAHISRIYRPRTGVLVRHQRSMFSPHSRNVFFFSAGLVEEYVLM